MIAEFKNLPLLERKKIIDYSVGLPADIVHWIHMSINKDFMDPALIKGDTRNVSIYAPIIKYLDKKKNTVQIENNPLRSDYQSEYCAICKKIDDIPSKTIASARYRTILNSLSCYDESFFEAEKTISEYFDAAELVNVNINDIISTIDILNEDIMIYKAKVYDMYQKFRNPFKAEQGVISSNIMEHILRCINKGIRLENAGYADCHDLAVLIYRYLKFIGIESAFENLKLFRRFKYGMMKHGKNEGFINDVYDNLLSLTRGEIESTTSLELIYPEKYSNVFLDQSNETDIDISDVKSAYKENNIVFFGVPKCNELSSSNSDWVSSEIRRLNKKMISEYIPNSKESDISFFLSENDFGNLRNISKTITVGTSYDMFNNTMRCIGLYDNVYYLLFKSTLIPGHILGISLNIIGDNDLRQILKIKRDSTCIFKYIPNI